MTDEAGLDAGLNEPAPSGDLEIITYEEGADGETIARVETNINSKEDLQAYREQKLAETEDILDATEEDSAEQAYYPAVITMKRPVSLAEMRSMLSAYDPTVADLLKKSGPIKFLPKAELIKNQDALVIDSVKFISTTGQGQLSYETLTQEKELSKLERQIATKEKELNGVEDFQLVKGVTSVRGGIHRDTIMQMQDDSRVFLADIGPAKMYEERPDVVVWEDIYEEVEIYSE